jgi:hypothetical protein
MDDKTIPVSAYFDERLLEKLKAVAAADDRSVSYTILQAVRELIAKPENVAKWSTNTGSRVGQINIDPKIAISKKASFAKTSKSK